MNENIKEAIEFFLFEILLCIVYLAIWLDNLYLKIAGTIYFLILTIALYNTIEKQKELEEELWG